MGGGGLAIKLVTNQTLATRKTKSIMFVSIRGRCEIILEKFWKIWNSLRYFHYFHLGLYTQFRRWKSFCLYRRRSIGLSPKDIRHSCCGLTFCTHAADCAVRFGLGCKVISTWKQWRNSNMVHMASNRVPSNLKAPFRSVSIFTSEIISSLQLEDSSLYVQLEGPSLVSETVRPTTVANHSWFLWPTYSINHKNHYKN